MVRPLMAALTLISVSALSFAATFYLLQTQPPAVPSTETFNLSSGAGGASTYLVSGWDTPEGWGTWSIAEKAVIRIPFTSGAIGPVNVKIAFRRFSERQHVKWTSSGVPGPLEFRGSLGGAEIANFVVPEHASAQLKAIELTAVIDALISPQSLGISPDPRRLGIGVNFVELTYVPRVIVSR